MLYKKAVMGSLQSLLNLNCKTMNTVLWNNPNNDGVWRAWVMSREKAQNVEYALSFTPDGIKAFLVNDSYRVAMLKDTNPQDVAYNITHQQEREVFDLTDITASRFGKRLIAKFKDHKFGQNPVNYAEV